ncbi:unnamed protein product [Effrenium voratum]|nr:unnamed protein product [Effrenium voratum]
MRVLWKLNFLHTAMDGFNSPMEVPMMDNGSETGRMDLAAIFGRIAPSTRANGGMTSRMEWVKKYGVMDLALKALSGWERRLALQRHMMHLLHGATCPNLVESAVCCA